MFVFIVFMGFLVGVGVGDSNHPCPKDKPAQAQCQQK